jgi:hypothetical protein
LLDSFAITGVGELILVLQWSDLLRGVGVFSDPITKSLVSSVNCEIDLAIALGSLFEEYL